MRLELKEITKRFPGVLANDRISTSPLTAARSWACSARTARARPP